MTIQHKDIPDAQRHEPKGITIATSGSVYTANGAGTGTWKFPELEGQSAAVAGALPFKNSTGISWTKSAVLDAAYSEIDSAETARSLTSLTEVPINGFFFDDFIADKFSITSGTALTVVEKGIYIMHYACLLKPQSALGPTNEVVEVSIKINGTVSNPYRTMPLVISKNASIDDPFYMHGSRILDLDAGDQITVVLKNLAATRNYKTQFNLNLHRIADKV